jgi:hypothetical protein
MEGLEKKCIRCQELKYISMFNKAKGHKYGVRSECRECTKKNGSKYYQTNKERITEYRKDTGEAERQKKWRKQNQHVKNFFTAEYRAKRKLAMPKWLTNEHRIEIVTLYKKAKEEGLSVDHIVPLNGDNVSGLHVPWNLQLLTLEENVKKSNKF